MSTAPNNKNQSEVEVLDMPDGDETVILMELDSGNSALMPDDIVRSEVNFLVLPFFALWDKDVEKRTETEFRAVVKRGNEKLEIVWNVSAHPKYGYPSPFDKRVHKAIEKIIGELPRPIENPIPLGSFYSLCDRMGIEKIGGSQYRKIKKALQRIIATLIESRGAFRIDGKKKWLEDTFHLYERLISKGEELNNGEIADTNYLYLNSWYLENVNANYVKPIDWDYYNSLETPLAQRLYELLGVKFYGVIMRRGNKISYRYSTLCDLLPITRQKYPSDAKKLLEPSHKKLKETDFLSKYSWDDTTPKTKGDWLITYYVGERAREEVRKAQNYFKPPQQLEFEALPEPERELLEPEEELEPLPTEQAELVERLVELNVTKVVADDLVRHFDNEFIQKWTDAIHYADAEDKAAYIVKAIRESWLLPEKWLKAKEREKDEVKHQNIKQLEEERKAEEERNNKEEAERLDNIYNSLSDEQRQDVDDEAERRLPFFARERLMEGATDSPIVVASLTVNRRGIIKEWLDAGKIDATL